MKKLNHNEIGYEKLTVEINEIIRDVLQYMHKKIEERFTSDTFSLPVLTVQGMCVYLVKSVEIESGIPLNEITDHFISELRSSIRNAEVTEEEIDLKEVAKKYFQKGKENEKA